MSRTFTLIFFNFLFMISRGFATLSDRNQNENEISLKKNPIENEGIVYDYYASGDFAGCIKEEFLISENKDLISLSRYLYENDSITVLDLFENKTVYKIDKERHLLSIERYNPKGEILLVENFESDQSKILSKSVEDGRGNVLVCERYFYDHQGCLIKKKIYSNLDEISTNIEEEILPSNGFFCYLNSLLKKESLPKIQEIVEAYLGPLYLMMAGYYNHPLECGVFGYGEAHDRVRITFINGILNRNFDCMQTAETISKTHGGANVHYIYRPTEGWAHDLMGSARVWFGSLTPQSRLLASRWKELIEEMGGVNSGGIIIHYAHSIGASDTWNARTLLTNEEKKMIRVVTIGSPFMIHKDGLHSVVNYVSVRDGVCLFDKFGYFRADYNEESDVVFVGNHFEGFPLIDHPILNPNYYAILYKQGLEFIESYGAVFQDFEPILGER